MFFFFQEDLQVATSPVINPFCQNIQLPSSSTNYKLSQNSPALISSHQYPERKGINDDNFQCFIFVYNFKIAYATLSTPNTNFPFVLAVFVSDNSVLIATAPETSSHG